VERAWRWARRNPAVAGLSAAVVMVMVMGSVVASLFAVDAYREARRADGEALRADKEAKEAGIQWARAEDEANAAKRLAGDEKKAREKAEESEKVASIGRHGFRMQAALQAWHQSDVTAAEAYLEDVSPAFQQTWEYRHVRELCRRKSMTLIGHMDVISSVATSADGRHIVSGSRDKRLCPSIQPAPPATRRPYAAACRRFFAGRGRSGIRSRSQANRSLCGRPKNRCAAVVPSARLSR